jgi:hypothetical protein
MKSEKVNDQVTSWNTAETKNAIKAATSCNNTNDSLNSNNNSTKDST